MFLKDHQSLRLTCIAAFRRQLLDLSPHTYTRWNVRHDLKTFHKQCQSSKQP